MRIVKTLIAIMALSVMMFSCDEEEVVVDPLVGTWEYSMDAMAWECPEIDDMGTPEDETDDVEMDMPCIGAHTITLEVTAATLTWSEEFIETGGDHTEACSDSGAWTKTTETVDDEEINVATIVWVENDAEDACGVEGTTIAYYAFNPDNADELAVVVMDADIPVATYMFTR